MSSAHITSAGCVDRDGFTGSAGWSASWSALGVDPRRDRLRWPAVFPRPFPDFRHLDRLSRVLAVAAECAGLAPGMPRAEETALAFISDEGCLDADARFERSLHDIEGTQSGLFPFTLTSTGLGALAIRHGFRGPTLAFSAPRGHEGRPLEDACELVASGEVPRLVLCMGDWVGAEAEAALGIETRAEIVALTLEAGDPLAARSAWLSTWPSTWPSIDELCAAADPVSFLAHHVRLAFPVGSR
jgi:hypothetical protein